MAIEKETLAVQRSAFMKCCLYTYLACVQDGWCVAGVVHFVLKCLEGGKPKNQCYRNLYPANLILYKHSGFLLDRNKTLALGIV